MRDRRRDNLPRLTVDYRNPAADAIRLAVTVLREGGLVVAPTETRYGLLCRTDSEAALSRMVEVKGRDSQRAVSVFVNSHDRLWELGRKTPAAEALSGAFLPGPMTLVLESRVDWPAPLVIERKIGLRLTDAPVIMRILQEIGVELTATSANRSGSADLTEMDQIAAQLGDEVGVYLDTGPLDKAVSTVVDLTLSPPKILREGAIASERIMNALETRK